MMQTLRPLTPDFYLRPADLVAQELLGKYLRVACNKGEVLLRLTETEAYLGREDQACHSYGGRRTNRTEAMYLTGGHAYVYFIYGNHFCLNVVTGPADDPCAVLLRAGEVVSGQDLVALRRFGIPWDELSPRQRSQLLNGPGKLCQSAAVGREFNGKNFFQPDFCLLEHPEEEPPPYLTSKRIGLGKSCGEDANLFLRYLAVSSNQLGAPI